MRVHTVKQRHVSLKGFSRGSIELRIYIYGSGIRDYLDVHVLIASKIFSIFSNRRHISQPLKSFVNAFIMIQPVNE